MHVVFFGSGAFGLPTLEALAQRHAIGAVVTQPDRKAGRGKTLTPTPIGAWTEEHLPGVPLYKPENANETEIRDTIRAHGAGEPDLAWVVIAFGQKLSPELLADRFAVNLHASLLPRWRGAAPIQRAIMAGDRETGVCVMQMEKGLDTGPVLARAVEPIGPQDTALSLHDRLAALSARLIVDTLPRLDSLQAVAQPDDGVTYAAKIEKAEARIDWSRPAAEVSAHIRGLSPFPGAWCEIGGERVKILSATEETAQAGNPGEALDDRLLIGCAGNAVRLTTLQKAGKRPAGAEEFLRGTPVGTHTTLT